MQTVLTLCSLPLLIVGLLFAVGDPGETTRTAEPPAAAGLEQPSAGVWHVVDEGESLRSLARRYYGSARMWRTLQMANDVDQLPHAGTRIWVPAGFPDVTSDSFGRDQAATTGLPPTPATGSGGAIHVADSRK